MYCMSDDRLGKQLFLGVSILAVASCFKPWQNWQTLMADSWVSGLSVVHPVLSANAKKH